MSQLNFIHFQFALSSVSTIITCHLICLAIDKTCLFGMNKMPRRSWKQWLSKIEGREGVGEGQTTLIMGNLKVATRMEINLNKGE